MVQTRSRQAKRKREESAETANKKTKASATPRTKKANPKAEPPKQTSTDAEQTRNEGTENGLDGLQSLHWMYFTDEHLNDTFSFLNDQFQVLISTPRSPDAKPEFDLKADAETTNRAFTLFHFSTSIHQYIQLRDEILRLWKAIEGLGGIKETERIVGHARDNGMDIWAAMTQLGIEASDAKNAQDGDLGEEWAEFQRQYAVAGSGEEAETEKEMEKTTEQAAEEDKEGEGKGREKGPEQETDQKVDEVKKETDQRVEEVKQEKEQKVEEVQQESEQKEKETEQKAKETKQETELEADQDIQQEVEQAKGTEEMKGKATTEQSSDSLPETQRNLAQDEDAEERTQPAVDDELELDLDDIFGDDM